MSEGFALGLNSRPFQGQCHGEQDSSVGGAVMVYMRASAFGRYPALSVVAYSAVILFAHPEGVKYQEGWGVAATRDSSWKEKALKGRHRLGDCSLLFISRGHLVIHVRKINTSCPPDIPEGLTYSSAGVKPESNNQALPQMYEGIPQSGNPLQIPERGSIHLQPRGVTPALPESCRCPSTECICGLLPRQSSHPA